MVSDLINSVRRSYCLNSKIPLIHSSQETVVHVQVNMLPKILQASHNDANGMKPGSNTKMTDKHDAEYSKNACLGVN